MCFAGSNVFLPKMQQPAMKKARTTSLPVIYDRKDRGQHNGETSTTTFKIIFFPIEDEHEIELIRWRPKAKSGPWGIHFEESVKRINTFLSTLDTRAPGRCIGFMLYELSEHLVALTPQYGVGKRMLTTRRPFQAYHEMVPETGSLEWLEYDVEDEDLPYPEDEWDDEYNPRPDDQHGVIADLLKRVYVMA
jgi:hypothetical protein